MAPQYVVMNTLSGAYTNQIYKLLILQKILSVACALLTTFPYWHHCLYRTGNSMLYFRKKGLVTSSILNLIVQDLPTSNTCRRHQDLRRRSLLQFPAENIPGPIIQFHQKMDRRW
jgi:hypothetical protein